MVAKNERAHRNLQDQFRTRQVEKVYLALVDGTPPTRTGRIEAPIGRDPAHRKQMAIVSEGKGREAVTEYKTLESFRKHTLLEVHPHTGRTHQIRLHLKMLREPHRWIRYTGTGIPAYPLRRQPLHAARLKITLRPGEDARIFEVPLPADLEIALKKCGQMKPNSLQRIFQWS